MPTTKDIFEMGMPILERGFDWILCNVCDTRISLLDREERLVGDRRSLILDLDRAADTRRDFETASSILQGKLMIGDADANRWEIIVAKHRRLHVLEVQQAQFGNTAPPHIITEIQDLRNELATYE